MSCAKEEWTPTRMDGVAKGYLKLGFGGAHTESNQRLM